MYIPHEGPQADLLGLRDIPEILFGGARGGGKGLCLSTEVMTKDGWSTIGELKVGDTIFDADGRPTVVLYKSEPTLRACYRLTFDNGQQIIADDVHRWITHTKAERVSNYKCTDEYREKRRAKRPSRAKANPINEGSQKTVTERNKARQYRYKEPNYGAMRSTQEIFETLKVQNGREVNHAIKIAGFVEQPERELPIPPYILGLWLGDGSADSARLTIGDEDAADLTGEIERCGYQWLRYNGDIAYKIWRDKPFVSELKAIGLIGNKIIPEIYRKASIEQRLALLQGLFDTDGSCNKDGQVEFCNTNESVAQGVYELLASLGAKPFITTKSPLCTNGKNGPTRGAKAWIVKATTTLPVFRLQRKKERLATKLRETQRWHYITKVEPIEPVWTQCLTVDSQMHTFLVSKAYIATHNTAALLGDFLQDVARYGEHWQGVLFRRSYPELEEVIKQSHKFYSPTGAYWRASSKSWHWANGACLRLRSLESREDASKYQGHEYCVALGTLVDTPTGPKKIEELRFGDAVMTASGVSRVTATLKPRRALCVKVEVNGKSQVHPIDHDFLTDLGWQSYASLQGISAKEFQEESLEWQSLPSLNVHAVCVQQRQRANIPSLETSKVSQTFCKFYEWSSVKPQGLFGLVLSSLKGLTRRLRSLTEELGNVSAHFGGENVNVLYCTTVTSNSQCDCPSCRHLHDAQPPLEQGIDLNALPLQGDVAKRLHAYSALGVRDSTRRYIHQYDSRYPHPYGGWELPMVGESFLTACEISVVGYYDVMDIQVESFNNYITTEARLINKNCWIGWDEVTNWPHNDMFLQMFACLRGSGQQVAARIRCSGNPGGPGHNWVKDRFMIGAHKKGWHPIYDPESNMTRLYIPSRTTDNPSLILNSPNYTRQLRAVGSKELVKAWLEGDWDIVLGAYFDEWSERDHVIPDIDPADLPKKWKIYRAYDHGSYHPFAVLWYTYAGPEFEKQGIERNTIIFLNEWFGANEQGKGLKLAISDVAEGIRRRERAFGRSIEPGPADNQIFEQDGGMPLSELMAAKGVYFERSDKRRIAGWNQVRYRLQTNLVRFCRACKNTISSFPSLQHDDTRQEDVDTTGNDHCADVVRYSCMAWPIEVQPEKVKDDIRDIVTYNELIEASEDLIRQVKRPL